VSHRVCVCVSFFGPCVCGSELLVGFDTDAFVLPVALLLLSEFFCLLRCVCLCVIEHEWPAHRYVVLTDSLLIMGCDANCKQKIMMECVGEGVREGRIFGSSQAC
jgi:hypothetical protein